MESRLLDGLSSVQKEKFLKICEQKKVHAGERMKKEGQKLSKAFFLVEGKVSVLKTSSSEEMEVAALTKDDDIWFSITCMLQNGKSLTSVVAKEECTILELTQKDFYDFCHDEPEIGVAVLQNVVKLISGFLQKSDEKISEMYKTLEEVL